MSLVLRSVLLVGVAAVLGAWAVRRRSTGAAVLLTLVLAELGATAWAAWTAPVIVARTPVPMVTVPVETPFEVEAEALPSGRTSLLFVGDSVTHGYGVGESARFSTLVGDALGVEVTNVGQPALSFADEVTLFTDVHWMAQPDVVVWVFFPNDLGLKLGGSRTESDRGRDLVLAEPPATGGSVLWSMARRAGEAREQRVRMERAYARALDPETNGAQLDRMERAIGDVVAHLRSRDAELLFVLFPLMHALDEPPFAAGHAEVAARASRAGANVLDLLGVFAGREASTLWRDATDHHPNAEAHQLAADAIVAALRGSLPRSREVGCEGAPVWRGEPAERAAMRQELCRRPSDPAAWMAWARWWRSGELAIRPSAPRRYTLLGLATAWQLSGEDPAVLAEAERVLE
jgi:lysophospholipase L1-like esterase